MTRRLSVGIVGAGIGAQHAAGFRALPDLYSLQAICDLDADKAKKFAAAYDIPTVLMEFEAMLGGDLDLISVCTPPVLHFAQARAVLQAGHHAIVEKPLVASLDEADALAQVEKESGRRLSPIFQYRFGDGMAQLRHLRERGFAGMVYTSTVETHWRRTAAYYDVPWRGRWATELGGCLVSHAIHSHDLLSYVVGPVESVYARTATRVNRIETEDCAAALLEMADGSFATLSVTLGAEEDMSRLRFCFEGLTAESNRSPYHPGAAPWRFIAADPARQKAVDEAIAEVAPGPERYAGQFLRLHEALTAGGPMPVSIADARSSIELATAAYHSARTGEPVRLPLGPEHPLYSGWLPPSA